MTRTRVGLLAATLAIAVIGSVAVASAGNEKITICHATSSLSNPYVTITISINAWSEDDPTVKHGPHHHRSKGGVEWQDYVLEAGECELTPDPPTDPSEPPSEPTDPPTDPTEPPQF